MHHARVLIADSKTSVRLVILHILRPVRPNFHIFTAPDGATALSKLQKQSFDVVITGNDMPDITGLELAEKVRQISPQTRIILMSRKDLHEFCSTVEKLRIDAYIKRPFSPTLLQGLVERVLSDKREESRVTPTPSLMSLSCP